MNLPQPKWSLGSARAMFPYLAKKYDLKYFIETGTGYGDTLIFMSPAFEQCWSIELDPWRYNLAVESFRHVPNVTLLHGNSKDHLKEILETLPEGKVLFWLDAHTDPGLDAGPLAEEIALIQQYRPTSLIAIDDVGVNPEHHHSPELPGIDLAGWTSEYKFDRILFLHNGDYDLSTLS